MSLVTDINRGCRFVQNFGLREYLKKKQVRGDTPRYFRFVQDTLEKQMKGDIDSIISQYDSSLIKPVSKEKFHIFVFWWQGEEQMPAIIRKCMQSIRRAAGDDFSIVLITKGNYNKLVSFDPVVIKKLQMGLMTLTHFSNILRVSLLEKYGGMWLDATLFVTDTFRNHPEIFANPIFSIHDKKPNPHFFADGKWAAYCWGANVTHHPLFYFEREFLNAYWNKYDMLIDYFLFDCSIKIAYDHFPAVKKDMDGIPFNNFGVHYLQRHANTPWDEAEEQKWKDVKKTTWIHKLSWKQPFDAEADNYYTEIVLGKRVPE